MSISAADVKRLREATGVGMMDCKKALVEANGDFDAAIDFLRKKGQKVAAKRADRDTKEGLIVAAVSDDNKKGVLAEINCETDFVARSDDFSSFASKIVDLVLSEEPKDLDALNALSFDGNDNVEAATLTLTGKVGEKVDIRRFNVMSGSEGIVVPYIHPGSRLGVLVEIEGNGSVQDAGRDVAMQVAALNPVATRSEEVSADIREKELEIAREAARNEGKPDNIVDRIAEGKLQRYFKDHVLVEQPFVKDSSITVREMLKQSGVDVKGFLRFALGD